MSTTINGTTGRNSSYWKYYFIATEQDVNIANNTSKLKVDVYLGATSYSRAVRGNVSATHTVTVNGTNYTFTTGAYTVEKNATILLGSITSNAITHEADGKKTVSVSASSPDLAQASGYGPYSGSASGNVTLTTIPRTSSVTCAEGNIGSTTTININRQSDTFTHTLTYDFGGATGTIVTKTSSTSISWTIPTTFYAKIPNAKSGTGTITCITYSGNTEIGTATCSFKVNVTNSNPTISATIIDTNTTITAITGSNTKLVKGYSNAKVTITATAKNSATISQKRINGTVVSGNELTINAVSNNSFVVDCTDSRGFTASQTYTKSSSDWIEYVKLAFTTITLARESSTSNTVNATINGNYFNSSIGSTANTLTTKWRYRESGGTWSGYTTFTATKSGNTFSYSATLGTEFDYQKVYEFQFVAQDKLATVTNIDGSTIYVQKGTPLIDIYKDNVKINGTLTATSFSGVNKVKGTLTNTTSSTTYFVPFYSTEATGNKDLRQNNGCRYQTLEGTDSAEGTAIMLLGNNIAKGTAGNKTGRLRLYSSGNGYVDLRHAGGSTTNSSLYFPDGASGYTLQTKPKSLYSNDTGTTGTVTLSETSANFNYIEIFFYKENLYSSVRVASPNGKSVTLTWNQYVNSSVTLQAISKKINISGTSITVDTTNSGYANMLAGGNNVAKENAIYITKVLGYK